MIVLNVICGSGHRFEGWFASADAFRSQQERRLVNCPHCQSAEVRLLPSAPHVRRSGPEVPAPAMPPAPAEVSQAPAWFNALARVAREAENVGERFPEEARRIHYDEAPARTIRGLASRDETLELIEEGIVVLPAPVPHEDDLH